jgi:uncharacterized membrane protein YuzA (DUF378 family)
MIEVTMDSWSFNNDGTRAKLLRISAAKLIAHQMFNSRLVGFVNYSLIKKLFKLRTHMKLIYMDIPL